MKESLCWSFPSHLPVMRGCGSQVVYNGEEMEFECDHNGRVRFTTRMFSSLSIVLFSSFSERSDKNHIELRS
jgi:hypothetical protein